MASIDWGYSTSVGRVRERNEDSLVAEAPLFAVADGMGGHAGGGMASKLAIEALSPLGGSGPIRREDIADAIRHANELILEHARAHDEPGMGTTLAGLALVSAAGVEHWLAFNVGDSRVYRLADGRLTQITVDHSEVQELIDQGRLTPAEARTHELRSVVTRALGTEPTPEPEWWFLPVVPGERFLVCSDGLSGELEDSDILAELETGEITAVADTLVRRAVDAGGRDNVSVIAIEVRAPVDNDRDGPDEDTRPRLPLRLGRRR